MKLTKDLLLSMSAGASIHLTVNDRREYVSNKQVAWYFSDHPDKPNDIDRYSVRYEGKYHSMKVIAVPKEVSDDSE